MVKKYTKKLKQSGSGFFANLKARIRGRNTNKKQQAPRIQEQSPQNQEQLHRTQKKENSSLLDKLFKKLCNKKMERYALNPQEEEKGLLYKACKYIYQDEFIKIDNEKNNDYKAGQKKKTNNRPFKLEELPSIERQLFSDAKSVLEEVNKLEAKMYANVEEHKKERDTISINEVRGYESTLKTIRPKIHDLFLKTKIINDQKTLTHFNVKYTELINRFNGVFDTIQKNFKKEQNKISNFKFDNNNIILNASGKRIFAPSEQKINKEKSIVKELSESLEMQDFTIERIKKEYNIQVEAILTTNKNPNISEIKEQVDIFINHLLDMQIHLIYINSTLVKLLNETNTYKNNLTNVRPLANLYKSVYNKFKLLFNTITTQYKDKLKLSDYQLDYYNMKPSF